MSIKATLDQLLPSSIEEEILNYLREQEREQQQNEGDQHAPVISYSYSLYEKPLVGHHDSYVKAILHEVLTAIERRVLLKNEYMKRLREHNQFDLFDLATAIPNFYIDDAIADQLCFRETLVVGYLIPNTKCAPPSPVGGLCLNIQKAKGSHPLDRKIPTFDPFPRERNDSAIEADDLKEIKEIGRVLSGDELSSSSAADLDEYKKILQHEMRKEHRKFLVHLSSQLDCDGRNGGSRITTWVDRNLHTLEENRKDHPAAICNHTPAFRYIVLEDGSVDEKSLYVALQTKRYYLKVASKIDSFFERKFYKLDKTKCYISEGANFLLMRYLAIANYAGTFELSTMYINGDMCRNIYICTGHEHGVINGKTLRVCKIKRIITEECGNVHRCVSVLTAAGRIVKQDWENSDYVLYVNPLVEVTDEKPSCYEKIPLIKRWEDDMQIFSQYLDTKNIKSMRTKSYLKDHPELKNLIADYVTKILHIKPVHVLDFSRRYFTQCIPEALDIPRNEYWNETEPPLY